MDKKWDKIFGIGLISLFVILSIRGFSDKRGAVSVLQQQGYSQITITGVRPFMRSSGELFSTGFRAMSPSSNLVTGAVTKGVWQGSTIRFD